MMGGSRGESNLPGSPALRLALVFLFFGACCELAPPAFVHVPASACNPCKQRHRHACYGDAATYPPTYARGRCRRVRWLSAGTPLLLRHAAGQVGRRASADILTGSQQADAEVDGGSIEGVNPPRLPLLVDHTPLAGKLLRRRWNAFVLLNGIVEFGDRAAKAFGHAHAHRAR